jgi:hypothetical protein
MNQFFDLDRLRCIEVGPISCERGIGNNCVILPRFCSSTVDQPFLAYQCSGV